MYTISPGHQSGDSLHVIREWAARGRYGRAADVATGTGFTAFAICPYADDVLATDLTPAMLLEAKQLATQRGLSNLSCALAAAEDLPFPTGSLDLLTCRFAAHHFQDLPKAVAEWQRALKPGGVLLFADTVCPEDEVAGRWLEGIEVRRDPSHVRNLPPSEWLAVLDSHGLATTDTAINYIPQEFDSWTQRSGTPPAEAERLRADFRNAPLEAVEAFHIRGDGDGKLLFQWATLVVRALRGH